MAKVKTAFFCKNCGHQESKWVGRCSSCGEWNTFTEEIISKGDAKSTFNYGDDKRQKKPKKLSEVSTSETPRQNISNAELKRVLGGGIVPGSAVLVGGEPGIGKSTLMLQVALEETQLKTLYILVF